MNGHVVAQGIRATMGVLSCVYNAVRSRRKGDQGGHCAGSGRSWLLRAEEGFAGREGRQEMLRAEVAACRCKSTHLDWGAASGETGPIRAALTVTSSLPSSEDRGAVSLKASGKGSCFTPCTSGKVPFQGRRGDWKAEEETPKEQPCRSEVACLVVLKNSSRGTAFIPHKMKGVVKENQGKCRLLNALAHGKFS